MAKIIAIAWKEVRVRFTSRSELLFFLILPVVFTVILGGISFGGGTADNRIVVLVVNEDGGTLAGELISWLAKSKTVRPEVALRDEAEKRFADREAPALLTIPAGFEASLRTGGSADLTLRGNPSSASALAADQEIRTAVGDLSRILAAASTSVDEAERLRPFASQADRTAYFETSLQLAGSLFQTAPERIEVTRAATAPAPTYDVKAQASAGELIVWVFIPLLAISELFATERAEGTLRRFLTTPTRKATYLLGVITGHFGAALVQMLILVAFGILVMKVDWGHSPAALAAMLVSFGLASVAFGTMLGTFVKTASQAQGLSIMLGMTLSLLGGCMYPIELFPRAVANATHLLPTTWAMQGMTNIVTRGQGLSGVLTEAAVLLGFAVVFFAIGVRRFRYE